MRTPVVGMLLAAVTMSAALAEPTLSAKSTSRAPAIDGRVADDPAWRDAAVATDFTLLGKPDKATQTTIVRVLYDKHHLYVAFTCREDRMAEVSIKVKAFDGPTYEDDSVELFLAPFADRTRYYHWVVNAAGVMRDELRQDVRWNSGAHAAAARANDFWTVELAIPFAALGLDETTPATWAINFCREEHPHNELSSWAPCAAGFHEPDHFGTLTALQVDLIPFIVQGLRLRSASARGRLQDIQKQARDYADLAVGRIVLGSCDKFLASLTAVEKALGRHLDDVRVRNLGTTVAQAEQGISELEARLVKLPMLRAAGRAGYVVCTESTMAKVRPDKPYHGKPAQSVRVTLARNEYEAAQLVVVPLRETLKKVKLSVTDLHGPGKAVLPASEITLHVVGYVNVRKSSGGATLPPGLIPDPLLPNEPTDVDRVHVQSWWLTVHAPPTQPAGIYRGEVRVRPHNAPEIRLPLIVRVWDFTLPTTSRLRSSYGLNMSTVLSKYDVAPGPGMPSGWHSSAWVGADSRGIPNYFGTMTYDLAFDYQVKHSGKRACRVHVTEMRPGSHETPRFCYYTDELKLEPHTDYEFSVWYRTAPDDRAGPAGYFGPAGATSWPPTHGEWLQGTYAFNSGDAKGIRVYLKVDHVGTVWFDDVRLAPRAAAPTANLLPNPSFEQGQEGARERLRDAYILDALRHRASPTNLVGPGIAADPEGRIAMDWREFDEKMELYVKHGLSAFNVFWCELPSGWGTVESVEDEKRIARARELLRQTEAHLDEKGWLPLAYIYTIDEPGAAAFPQVKQAFELAHSAAPRLKTLLTYGYGASLPIEPGAPRYADLAGYVDIHVPHSDCYEPIYLRKRQQAGDEVWAYVCISAMRPYLNIWGIDYPGIDHRLLYWQLFDHDITGFLYWEIAYWQKDPWQDTMTYPGGNADGSLIYPGPDGPVDSIRWELCRDGTEDYDMLVLLRETSAAVYGRPGHRVQEPLLNLSRLTRSWTDYSEDPQLLELHRLRVGDRVEALTRVLERK